MIRVRLKIGDGSIVDTETQYGFIYIDSDKRVGPDTRSFESTSYPEEEGEHIIPKSVDAPFDYKVKFFIQATNQATANDRIAAFNALLYDRAVDGENNPTDTKIYKQVTFFNDYKRHKIVGYPSEIAEATEFWRDRSNQLQDIVIIEFTIRVTKPSLCEYSTPFAEDITSQQST